MFMFAKPVAHKRMKRPAGCVCTWCWT